MNTLVLNKKRSKILKFSFLNRFISLAHRLKKETIFVYMLFFVVSILLISIYNKYNLHLLLNEYNSPFFDVFFKYATHLGDGVLFGILFLIFFFVERKVAYAFAIGGLITLLITHFLKRIVFNDIPRPAGFFGVENLHIVDGVKMAFWNSFPSGHTTAAFTIFTILCLCTNKCKSQYVWITLALIAGVSRVYLSQHYWLDIFIGSFIGIFIGFISMAIFYAPKRVH